MFVHRFAEGRAVRWEASIERAEPLCGADDLVEEVAVQQVTGLETWFGRRFEPLAPPRWKVGQCHVAGDHSLLVVLMNIFVLPLISGWALVLRLPRLLRHV